MGEKVDIILETKDGRRLPVDPLIKLTLRERFSITNLAGRVAVSAADFNYVGVLPENVNLKKKDVAVVEIRPKPKTA